MKTWIISLICCLSICSAYASGKAEATREITKNFSVSAAPALNITNKYGNIFLSEWDRNEIYFSIQIIGEANNLSDAQKIADAANIDFSQSGNRVTAATDLSGYSQLKLRNSSIKIHYTVKIPAKTSMDLTNTYGNIDFEQTEQPFKAIVKYGNLTAEKISGTDNNIEIKYGNLYIGELSRLNLDLKYSELHVEKAGTINMISAYSKITAGTIGTLVTDSKYDTYKLNGTDNTTLSSAGYSKYTINTLTNRFEASSVAYSDIKILSVSKSFKSIIIDCKYTDTSIGIAPDNSYNATLSVRYGDIKAHNLSIDGGNYTGKIGQGNATAEVKITSSYGNVRLSD